MNENNNNDRTKINDQFGAYDFKSITEYPGKLEALGIENNAVIVMELYSKEKRPCPQQQLIDEDIDLCRQAGLVQGSSVKVMVRNSRTSDRSYLFYKADSVEEYRDILPMISSKLEEIKKEDGCEGRRVYMERSRFDTDDSARKLLAESGFKTVYCLGRDVPAEQEKLIFPVDFTFKDLYNYCRSRIIGQDRELKKAAYIVYDFVLNAAHGNTRNAVSWLLTAPSGMGKTEFYRAVRDFLEEHMIPVPVIQYDLSHVTEVGYKGDDAKVILNYIYDGYSSAGTKKLPCGTAICFLDEADKKFEPSVDKYGRDGNSAAQGSLLTMIEGSKMIAPESEKGVDTSNTMFVLMGAFQSIRDKKQKNGEAMRRIFADDDELEGPQDCFYDDITVKDMIEQGMLEELAGRISISVNFHKLSEDDMRRLIRSKAEQISRERGIRIKLTDKAVDALMTVANTNLGVRAPMNLMTELAFETLARHSIDGSFDRSRDMIVIEGKAKARIEKRKRSELDCV